ncbi:sensor histidine kinase [Streptococcus raffinosi]|uniref:GHKL domain-containing protein n=1 Tax=Streptococcus raffinosi TaxID=3053355 RepID=A0ABT7LTH8_9STRE|nr:MULTISPECIES: GHKL domain-containing protein [unclassified Streptococcus]MDL5042838.1 GHKL domain-containing protein [Streptococcus sp. VTCC 12812]MDM0093863.1 GHKL domain-containing protein [Streptococcus sp. VTCC 12813]
MMIDFQIALEYLLHFIVIQWIYEQTSLVRVPRLVLPLAFLVEFLGGLLGSSFGVGLSFMTPFYLLFYAYFFGKERTANMLAFYAFYPLVIYLLIFNGYSYFLMPAFNITSDFLNKSYLYFIFFDLLIVPTFVALSKLLNIDFKSLRVLERDRKFSRIMFFTNFILISYVILNYAVVVASQFFSLYYAGPIVTLVGFASILFAVYSVNKYADEYFENQRRKENRRHLDDLEKYSEQVESLYETLRCFRHDYTNVLISLSEAIQMRDIDQIKMIYDTVLKDSASDLKQQKFDLAKLTHVTNMPLKSLLSSKLAEAFDKGIHCHVEVEEGVFFTDMRALDLITITSILCDNAIEAAVLSETPKLSIAIFKMEGQSVIAVENSTKEDSIDITPLKKRGFSTKGTGRGLGLANIEEILFRYDNVSLETESAQHRFVQLLSVTPKQD